MHVNLLIFSSLSVILDSCLKTSSPFFTPSFWTQRKKHHYSFTRPTISSIFVPLLSNFLQVLPCSFFPFPWLLSPSSQTCSSHPYLKICTVSLTVPPSQRSWSLTFLHQVHPSLCTVLSPQNYPINIFDWVDMSFQRAAPHLLPWQCSILVLLLSLWFFPLSPLPLFL